MTSIVQTFEDPISSVRKLMRFDREVLDIAITHLMKPKYQRGVTPRCVNGDASCLLFQFSVWVCLQEGVNGPELT